MDAAQVTRRGPLKNKQRAPTRVGGPLLMSGTGVPVRGDYLPARYEVHMLFMRLFWPALNVFMQES